MKHTSNTCGKAERISEIEALYERIDIAGYISADDARQLRIAVRDLLAMVSDESCGDIKLQRALAMADHFMESLLVGVIELTDDEVIGYVPPHSPIPEDSTDVREFDIPF